MKRLSVIALILVVSMTLNAYAAGNTLLDMRGKILKESKEIKTLLTGSRDVYLINSMWDSCVLAMTQLDAYFSMLGIFNAIPKENTTQAAVDYLLSWLREIKKSNELNVKSLNSISDTIEPGTKTHLGILKAYFIELNSHIDAEINKVSLFRRSAKR